ncbi:MAG: S41 family peptidase [Chloroflexota bacterium]
MNEQSQSFRFPFFATLFVVLAFTGGYVFGQSPVAPLNIFPTSALSSEEQVAFDPLFEVWNILEGRYLRQPLDETILVEGAINGMLETLEDEHTRYLSPEAQSVANERIDGSFQGIGAVVESTEDGSVIIVSPIDGSPAEAAGLQTGDILREADGVDLTGMDISAAAALVRGPAGTGVNLLIERGDESFVIEIIRDVIMLESVRGELIEGDIIHLRISQFGSTTAEDMTRILEELMAENPSGLIIDVRSNPGGLLDAVVSMADEFLDEGLVLLQNFGPDEDVEEHVTTADGIAQDIPIVVLIDEGSASASEVLAGAISDRDRGVLIGQTTFGKGTVQNWIPLSNGGGFRVTIAEWLTPDNNSIDKNGLTPDIFIPLPGLDEEFEDTQLQAAVDFLRGEEVISIPPEVVEEE